VLHVPPLAVILLLVALPLWLAASYGARYGFMEDGQWVGICADEASRWECQVRSNLGLMIHFKVLGWAPWHAVSGFLCRGAQGGAGGVGWCSGCRRWRCTTPHWRYLRW
jgi:hypothetical protein